MADRLRPHQLCRLLRPNQRRSDLGPLLTGATKIPDRYQSFAELAANEAEGVAFAIRLHERPSAVAILAPHGGTIEPTTSLIAAAIAAEDHSLYSFEALTARSHAELHLTSTRFDEPQAVALAGRAQIVVAVHGYLEAEPDAPVLVGGLDIPLVDLVASQLKAGGFSPSTAGHRFPATDPGNLCNRSARGMGVQLELPRALRDHLRDNRAALASFSAAVRYAIATHLAAIS